MKQKTEIIQFKIRKKDQQQDVFISFICKSSFHEQKNAFTN